MAALDTVQQYVTEARTLLQDLISPYRYTDDQLINGLNYALMEARKLRPDLFLGRWADNLFAYDDTMMATPVPMDAMYRMALVFHLTGYTQLRDDESENDQRAAGFMQRFTSMMVGNIGAG